MNMSFILNKIQGCVKKRPSLCIFSQIESSFGQAPTQILPVSVYTDELYQIRRNGFLNFPVSLETPICECSLCPSYKKLNNVSSRIQ